MKFIGLRYFVIKINNTIPLFEIETEVPLNTTELFIQSLEEERKIQYFSKYYSIRFMSIEDSSFRAGFLCKSKEVEIVDIEKRIQTEDVDSWDLLFFVIDIRKQIIILEQNKKLVSETAIQEIFKLLSENKLNAHGLECDIQFIVQANKFWEIIKSSTHLFSIRFNLNAPNLFGESKSINENLRELKKNYNITNTTHIIENKKGKLNIDNDTELEAYRSYSDAGGGDWKIRHTNPDETETTESSSKDFIKKMNVNIDKENLKNENQISTFRKYLPYLIECIKYMDNEELNE